MCVGSVPNFHKLSDRTNLKEVRPIKNISTSSDHKKLNEKEYSQDFIALTTQWTKEALNVLNYFLKSFQNTTFYRIFSSTTQPAHFILLVAVFYLAYLYLSNKAAVATISPLWTLLYLGSFCAHFGAQIWMTFISGLSLYFALPRHTFGSVQRVLFPRYFLLNSMLSMVTLAIFLRVKTNELKTMEIGVQAFAMSFCFLIELLIFLYLVPPLVGLISSKTAIEKEAGTGMEVGKFELGKLRKCPHYIKILKAFRKVHMTIAIGNMCALGCTSLHLYYLACKLCTMPL